MYKMISWDLADNEIHFIIRAKVFKTYSQQEAGARETEYVQADTAQCAAQCFGTKMNFNI